jgi:adenosylcobinamide amidohydrolase
VLPDPAAPAPAEASPRLELRPPWLVVRFPDEREVLSWAVVGGGRRRAPAVAWLEVKNADLPPGVDPRALLAERLAERGLGEAVGLLTSRRIERFEQTRACAGEVSAAVVATVGLGNALAVGDPPGAGAPAGTINILCALSTALSEEAALEALSIAAEARTAAVREAALPSRRSGRPATGTGTDCVVLAWPPPGRDRPALYAGKHTEIGHVIGAAVGEAVRRGVAAWREEQRWAPG